jgi:hypothetical protein
MPAETAGSIPCKPLNQWRLLEELKRGPRVAL